MKTIRNYLFILLIGAYIIYFFSWKWDHLFKSFEESFRFWKYIIYYFNLTLFMFMFINIISILEKNLGTLVNIIFLKKQNKLKDIMLDSVLRFISIAKYPVSLYFCINIITISSGIEKDINKIIGIIILVLFLSTLTWFINDIFEKIPKFKNKLETINKTFFSFMKKAIIFFIWVIGVLIVMWKLWFNISTIIAWAWIWWVAIALAAKQSISNIFWAIIIILNKPFEIWDYINIDWTVWTVKEIWVSYIKITEKMWYQVMIPNEKIISSNIINYSIVENRRSDFSIWTTYNTDLKKLEKWVSIIENILEEKIKDWSMLSYRVNFNTFWDFSLNIDVTYFSSVIDYTEFLKQREKINLEIKEEFKKEEIEMAFPTQEIIIKKD